MNLKIYDAINYNIDKQKTWIDVAKHQILSREIKFRPYVTISKRYNKDTNDYDYFIIMLDEAPTDRTYARTKKDDYNRIKININCIWRECFGNKYTSNVNININHIDSSEDGDVYKLEV